MRKLRIFAYIVTVLSCFLVIFPITVFADTTKPAETSSEGTSIELTVDVNQRFTDGLNYDGDKLSQNVSAKALYIGVICMLLLAGIIIIAVRARCYDEGDEDGKDEKDGGDSAKE